MRDSDIRSILHASILREHHEDRSTRVVEELPICQGEVRVDIAVINGELSGLEIKSAFDTLDRLPRQAVLYSAVFDRMTIVAPSKHHSHIAELIPDWWGIVEVPQSFDGALRTIRPAGMNPSQSAYSIATLLWRTEALEVLSRYGKDRGLRTKPKPALWQALSGFLALPLLREEVRAKLKQRENWKVPQ